MFTSTQKDALIALVREAGEIILSASDVHVKEKSTISDYVTEFDVAVQNFLKEGCAKLFPDALFFAEEQKNDPAVFLADHCFVIDPIDGTTNFIHRYALSSISVALFSKGEPIFGMVYQPESDRLYHAEKGKGAYLTMRGRERKIEVSDRPFEHALSCFGSCPYYKATLADQVFGLAKDLYLSTSDVRRTGSAALDLACVAGGQNDIFVEFLLSPWDFAAGSLLVTEAGGIITDMKGDPIDYTHPSSVLAASKTCHGRGVELAKKYL